MATIENVADMLFSGLTSVAMGSYARTPPQAERTQSHRPQRGELLAEPALNVAGSISFRFHVVCVSYNTHTLQGFSSRTVSLSPHTKRQATSTQRQQKNWGWARMSRLLTTSGSFTSGRGGPAKSCITNCSGRLYSLTMAACQARKSVVIHCE